MLAGCSIEGPLRVQGFVHVVEALAVGREHKTAKISARKHAGECFASFDIEALKSPGALSSFFHLIEQQASIWRDPQRLDGRVLSRFPVGRVQQKLIFALRTFTHIDTRLLLVRKTLSEEIAGSGFLQGVISFDSKEFLDAFPDLVPSRNVI